jgi:hypothetical protein
MIVKCRIISDNPNVFISNKEVGNVLTAQLNDFREVVEVQIVSDSYQIGIDFQEFDVIVYGNIKTGDRLYIRKINKELYVRVKDM